MMKKYKSQTQHADILKDGYAYLASYFDSFSCDDVDDATVTGDCGFMRDGSGRCFSDWDYAEDTYTDRVFDGWNPVFERVFDASTELPLSDTVYVWGADLSGSMQGAGGVGGLLAVKRDGVWYAPLYDANGNVTAYASEAGTIVAEYEYDAFGNTISQSGPLSDDFRHRFSTKPWIVALDVYDFGERVYSPELRRWLSRDPIEEDGGLNLYAMCGNDAVNGVDLYGLLVMVLDIKREREGDGFVDTSSTAFQYSLKNIDSLVAKLRAMPDARFNALKADGKVTFNGKKYSTSKNEYSSDMLREKKSQFITALSSTYDETMEKFKQLVTIADRDYDIAAFCVHGRSIGENRVLRVVSFNGNEKDTDDVIKAVRELTGSIKGVLHFISCYRSWKPGKDLKETAEYLRLEPAKGEVNDCTVRFNPTGIKHFRYQKQDNGKWRAVDVPHE